MSDNSSDENVPVVDVNTDDLDAFSKLMDGTATPKVEEETKEEVHEESDDEDAEEDSLATDASDEAGESAKEDSEDEDSEAEVKPTPKPKSRFQERIDQLTTQNKETRRLLDEALSKLNQVADEKIAPKQETKATTEVVPSPDDKSEDGEDKYPLGEFDPLFIRDLTRFTIQQESNAQKIRDNEERQQAKMEEARTALHADWAGKLEKARETYPDLSSSNASLEEAFTGIEPNYGEYLASTIMSLDYGVDVLHYLGNNLEEARKIVASGPTKATISLGRLEARFLEADKEKEEIKKPKVSAAPEPPPSTTRGSGTKNSIAPDTDDLDAFEKVFYSKKR